MMVLRARVVVSLRCLLVAIVIAASGQTVAADWLTLASTAADEVDFDRSLDRPPSSSAVVRLPRSEHSEPARESTFVSNENTGPSASSVRVGFWAELETHDPEGVEVYGVLHNRGSASVRIARVVVEISVSLGEVRRRQAFPRDAVLDAGESTSFRARFPGLVEQHADPIFEIVHDNVDQRPRAFED